MQKILVVHEYNLYLGLVKPSVDDIALLSLFFNIGHACFNGKESTVNRALGGSTYPGQKLVRSSLRKKNYYETQQLILGTGTAIWWMTEPH